MNPRNLALGICLLVAHSAFAGTINLNDEYNNGDAFCSDNYSFDSVVETNGPANEPAVNYYQTPTTLGDTLNVNPVNFRVDVAGPQAEILDSQLEMIICGKNGQSVPQIIFEESGDYEVLGFNAGDVTVTASLNYFWEVLSGSSAGMSGSGSETFSDSAAPSATGTWDLGFAIDLPEGAECVRFEFDNRLSGLAADGSAGFIAKKQIPGITITVPEPHSSVMAILGLIAVAACRSRK